MNGSPGLKSPRVLFRPGKKESPHQAPPTPWERLLLNAKGKLEGTPTSEISSSALYKEWKEKLKKNAAMSTNFCNEYQMMKQMVDTCGNGPMNLWSLRQSWEMVFTTRCLVAPPCGSCRDCSIRIAQAAIVVYAAQGVADENILPHLGAVFRSPRYKHFGIEEWVLLPVSEVATVLNHCSMQAQNALYIHYFLEEVAHNGVPGRWRTV